MTQDISNVLHGRTIAEQSACNTVAKHVRIGSVPSTSSEGRDYRVLGDTGFDRDTIRRDVANEDRTVAGLGSFVAQIICDCVTGGPRQWKLIGEMRLGPGYANDPAAPIDVVDPKLYDLGTPEPKIGNASYHRVSPSTGGQMIVK